MGDWDETRARLWEAIRELERESDTQGTQDAESMELAADIRAALERVKELERKWVSIDANRLCLAATESKLMAAEAKLAKVVEALERVLEFEASFGENDIPDEDRDLARAALAAAAKGE